MPKFRQKPVVIEAMQYFSAEAPLSYILSFDRWLKEKQKNRKSGVKVCRYRASKMTIPRSEGDLIANHGDWIICGVNGELYPCRPDIFAQLYEQVEE